MIRTRRIPAAAVSVVAAIALCAASAGPVTARAKDSGTTVSSSSATTGQKILKCKLANRQVTVVATAVKSLAGQHYGVAATTTGLRDPPVPEGHLRQPGQGQCDRGGHQTDQHCRADDPHDTGQRLGPLAVLDLPRDRHAEDDDRCSGQGG
jgi:hypothetical protein